ncbi:hypothetical protein GBAR_LOCUS27051 [Geodia barretti]|uniref:Uncharacterized protein n=1 Tax=Geodia barretti TaxID=519541 RepID=A0AA35X8A6_GEOBA|nr:hypothetical protein GBAR_LOCUS27051 [Geodia barretti]
MPRSAILAVIAELRRTFLAERSRWMTGGLCLWRKARPRAMSCRIETFTPSGMATLLELGSLGSSISCRLVIIFSITR